MARPHRLALLGVKGRRHPRFKNGRLVTADGYVKVLVGHHPWPRLNHYMFEHVKKMERKLGRRLRRNEVVHHRNHRRDDNRLRNLVLMLRGAHCSLHRRKCRAPRS